MFIIYDLAFLLISLFYLPIYLFKGKFHKGFAARFGKLPKNLKFDRPIWIHAVSVGEVMAVRKLADELCKDFPNRQLIVSTVTATGNKVARDAFGENIFVTYLPLDISFIIRKVFCRIKPSVFVLAETEIWPNLISFLHKQKIPLIVVNGRISDRSYCGYRFFRLFIGHIFNKIDLFCVQTEIDAGRLKKIGVSPQNLEVTGNMKFDIIDYTDFKKDYADYKQKLCPNEDGRLFVAGSTHPGEEEMLLEAYKELLNVHPGLVLLIAPRHPERSKSVEMAASKYGFRSEFISSFTGQCSHCLTKAVFILDSVGKLAGFYSIADFVFVGGSLVKKGGHNIIEPAAYAKPIMFGPYMFNFRDIASLFLEKNAALLVKDKDELVYNMNRLLGNERESAGLGERARALIKANRGATEKNKERIKAYAD